MKIEPASDTQFVKQKLTSGIYSYPAIIKATDISRYQMRRLIYGLPVKAYVVITLNDYFRKLGA